MNSQSGILLLIISALFISTFIIGFQKQETKECKQWAHSAETTPGWYYTKWQKEQCHIK